MSGTTLHSVAPSSQFLLESAGLTLELLEVILEKIQSANLTTLKFEYHLNKLVSDLTQDVSQFVELTTLISKTMMQRKLIVPKDIKNSHIHLLFIMKGMGQACLKQDLVALEDLIKYELKDNLTQWKIDLIPQTKRLLKN